MTVILRTWHGHSFQPSDTYCFCSLFRSGIAAAKGKWWAFILAAISAGIVWRRSRAAILEEKKTPTATKYYQHGETNKWLKLRAIKQTIEHLRWSTNKKNGYEDYANNVYTISLEGRKSFAGYKLSHNYFFLSGKFEAVVLKSKACQRLELILLCMLL